MRQVDTNKLSKDECWGIQIYGLGHCRQINCKWQGISACAGQQIIKTGFNALGFKVGQTGLASLSDEKKD